MESVQWILIDDSLEDSLERAYIRLSQKKKKKKKKRAQMEGQ
jgi:hypothetical protein